MVGADPHRQDQDGDEREARGRPQRSGTKPQILQQLKHMPDIDGNQLPEVPWNEILTGARGAWVNGPPPAVVYQAAIRLPECRHTFIADLSPSFC